MRNRGWMLAAFLALDPMLGSAGEIVQTFPAQARAGQWETRWRVVWDVVRHDGQSEILYIKEAWFCRGPKEREIQVLGDCRLAEIFVRYNNGVDYFDVSGTPVPGEDIAYDLGSLQEADLGPACVMPGKLLAHPRDSKRKAVALEVHDDQVRWRDNMGRTRRGQVMYLWATMLAGNYQYLMKYAFRDDGQVGFRVGATAHNHDDGLDDDFTHVHMGCWRLHVVLGNATKTSIYLVRNPTSPGGVTGTLTGTRVERLTREARIKWNPEEFSRLVVLGESANGHQPAHRIGYELAPISYGQARYYAPSEKFTLHDFWVTKAKPHAVPPELQYKHLDRYENCEAIEGTPAVLWHQACSIHRPRDEDFGQVGYDRWKGVALTVWAGFDLKPRNFFAKTPLYPELLKK